jgi:hypothetical protein
MPKRSAGKLNQDESRSPQKPLFGYVARRSSAHSSATTKDGFKIEETKSEQHGDAALKIAYPYPSRKSVLDLRCAQQNEPIPEKMVNTIAANTCLNV